MNMLKRKGFSVLVLLVVLIFFVACQPGIEQAEPVQPVDSIDIIENTATESPIVEETSEQNIEPVTLDSEQAVLEQLQKVLED